MSFAAIAALVCWAAQPGNAKVIYAVSCQFTDVSNAVAEASVGDVVQLPAGTNWWSETLNLNGVSLIGSGTNSTVLIDEEPRAQNVWQMINLTPATGYFAEIANIQFAAGVTNTTANFYGAIQVFGSPGSSWRIDHNVFNQLYAKGIVTTGNSMSLVDHNTFYEREISVSANSWAVNDGGGDISWSSPPTYGPASTNCLYMEDNYITNTVGYVASVGAMDGNTGSRVVFRHNTVWNDLFNNHGTETEGRARSQRSFEIYDNTFNATFGIFSAALLRGGSGVVFSNTINGAFGSVAELRTYRYTCSYLDEWDPFGGANGLSLFDSNSPTLYLTGTNSAPNGSSYLQVNGANWTPNQWYGYTVLDTNSGIFSLITANTANTIYYIGSSPTNAGAVACTPLAFNVGDGFQIRRVYASLDQIGRGSGNLLQDQQVVTSLTSILSDFPFFTAFPWLVSPTLGTSGVLTTINTYTGNTSWPNEVLEGVYVWGNTLDGVQTGVMSYYPTLQLGRDFYNSAKPGYTPLVYPHPLQSETYVGIGAGGGPTNTPPPATNPPPTNGLQPPTNFHPIH